MTQYTSIDSTSEIPYGYCQCGCGEQTKKATKTVPSQGWIKNRPIRFINGHQNRTDFAERFFAYVDKETSSPCWIWVGYKRNGYGSIWHDGKSQLAHRAAWEIENGLIPAGLIVMHSCDNRLCVRMSHLSLGVHQDNMSDMVAKNRQAKCEQNGRTKLTWELVDDIRLRYAAGETDKRALGRMFGVSDVQISHIVTGQQWRK